MKVYWIYIVSVATVIHQSTALRCRSGNGKLDKSIQKAVIKCKHEEANNSSSLEDDSIDENTSSDSSIFDDEFFSFNKKNHTNSNTRSSGNPRSRHSNNDDNEKPNSYQGSQRISYTQNANSSRKIGSILRNNYNGRDQKSGNDYEKNTRQSSAGKGQNSQRTDDHSKSCFFKCLLNEFNAINRQGFPERTAVTNLMLKDIHNPAVRDVVEEMILECFHFLQTQMIEDECTFSQYLFECFDNKGRERCDDWNI